MRKTYASMCDARGVPTDFIREQLGHSSLSTTYGYIYNPLTEEETYGALVRALSSKTDPEDNTAENIVDFPSKQNKNDLSPTCRQLSPRFRAKQKSGNIDKLYVSASSLASARRGSNPRSSPWQGDVLPLYHSRISLCSFVLFPSTCNTILPEIVFVNKKIKKI